MLRQVAEGGAAVGGEQHASARSTEAVHLAVGERAAQVQDVRAAGRREDDVVVPALPGAVADVLRRRQVGERSRPLPRRPSGRRAPGSASAWLSCRSPMYMRVKLLGNLLTSELTPGRCSGRRSVDRMDLRQVAPLSVERQTPCWNDAEVERWSALYGSTATEVDDADRAVCEVPDLRERRTGLAVQASAATGGGGFDDRPTGNRADTAHARAMPTSRLPPPSIDKPRDRAALERVAARDERPRVTAVRGLPDPSPASESRKRSARRCRIDGVARRIGWVDEERADRIRPERPDLKTQWPSPPRKDVVGHPDAATGGARQRSCTCRDLLAATERQRRYAAGSDVRLAAGEELVEHSRVLRLDQARSTPTCRAPSASSSGTRRWRWHSASPEAARAPPGKRGWLPARPRRVPSGPSFAIPARSPLLTSASGSPDPEKRAF